MKLSILIPCYNRERTVVRAVDSALSCNWPEFEVIISDNASTDNTLKILEKYSANSNVKILRSDKNHGPVPNWKKCLDHATGTHVHWLWSDDWVEQTFYAKSLDILVSKKADAVVAAVYVDRENDPTSSFVTYSKHFDQESGHEAAGRVFAFWNTPQSPASSILPMLQVRKHFYQGVGWIGVANVDRFGFGTDSLILAGSLSELSKIYYINLPCVHFTGAADSISKQAGGMKTVKRRYTAAHLWFMAHTGYIPPLASFVRIVYQAIYARYIWGILFLPLVYTKNFLHRHVGI